MNLLRRSDKISDALHDFNRTGGLLQVLIDNDGKFERTVTEGDVRRLLLDGRSLHDSLEHLAISQQSVCASVDMNFKKIQNLFEEKQVKAIPLLDSTNRPIKILRAEDFKTILLAAPHLGGEEQKFVDEAFRTNWVAPVGPNLDEFETDIKNYTGTKAAVALSSGTAAIHLGLILLGIKPGDAVLCSALTFAASVNPIYYAGAYPILVDSEPNSWTISPQALTRAIESSWAKGVRPKAAIIVNLYGQMADFDSVKEICRKYEIAILEDAAESMGAKYKGKQSGTLGELSVFSFNGNKIITTSGGGALLSDNSEWIEKARFLSTQAREPRLHYEHCEIGYNYRMSNILAGIGRGQMLVLDDRISRKRQIFEFYKKELSYVSAIEWMPEANDSFSTRWLSAMIVKPGFGRHASDLISFLSANGVEARPVWKPMQMQPVFSNCAYFEHEAGRSVSQYLFENGVCLPSGTGEADKSFERVVELIDRFFNSQ